ncbi:hypothetical protein [Arthrobacter sp. H14-L1]|uniref:hypothetical protein n=1 Tax=Arthrobacter sp. H14-L1 TaxID=2996697 RepID=UPI003B640D08
MAPMALLIALWTLGTTLLRHGSAPFAGGSALPAAQDDGGRRDPSDRGDVPGWVMITLMSAVLVAGLLAIAGPALEGLFNQAISQVNKGG